MRTPLRKAGFNRVDAYRFNAASIPRQVVGKSLRTFSPERRGDGRALFEGFPERTQADIVSLSRPARRNFSNRTLRISDECGFDDPSPSMLLKGRFARRRLSAKSRLRLARDVRVTDLIPSAGSRRPSNERGTGRPTPTDVVGGFRWGMRSRGVPERWQERTGLR